MNRKTVFGLMAAASAILNVLQPGPSYAAPPPQDPSPPTWDDRFGPPGLDGQATATAVAANGHVFVGGTFTKAGGVPANSIARWDGARWHALGAGLQGAVAAPRNMLIDGNHLIVVGRFNQAGAANVNQIAQWDGNTWSAIGNGEGPRKSDLEGVLHAVALLDGKLIVGGNFDTIDGMPANNIAQWDGNTWAALGGGVGKADFEGNFSAQGEVRVLAVENNLLYVGGEFAMAGDVNTPAHSVARWDGTNWAALGDGVTVKDGNDEEQPGLVTALNVHDGAVYAGGLFTKAGALVARHIAMWQNNTPNGEWSALGAGLSEPLHNLDPVVNSILISGTNVYAGGNFIGAGGQPIALLGKWDGASWSAVGSSIQKDDYDVVNKLAALPNGELLIAGGFRLGGNKRADNVARWNGAEWMTLGLGAMRHEYGDSPARPYAIATDADGRVYVGGELTRAGGLAVNGLAMWDGSRWHNIGQTNARVRAIAVVGDDVFIGGEFTEAGGIAASHIARWNRTSEQWSALGAGINDHVYALVFGGGVLYAGGGFSAAGNVAAHDVAYWDGAQWHALGNTARIFEIGDRGNEVGTQVYALAVRGNSVFIGGHFQTIQHGTNTANLSSFTVVHNVVEWDRSSDTWLWLGDVSKRGVSFNGYSGFQVDVRALALMGDVLYIGGRFNQAGAAAALNLAAWNAAVENWQPLNAGIGGFDDAAVWGLSGYGNTLVIAGKFTSAGNTSARYVAQLNTASGVWSALGTGLSWYNDQYTLAQSVAATHNGIYVGGDFDKAGGIPTSGFGFWQAALDGGTPTPAPTPKYKVFIPAAMR